MHLSRVMLLQSSLDAATLKVCLGDVLSLVLIFVVLALPLIQQTVTGSLISARRTSTIIMAQVQSIASIFSADSATAEEGNNKDDAADDDEDHGQVEIGTAQEFEVAIHFDLNVGANSNQDSSCGKKAKLNRKTSTVTHLAGAYCIFLSFVHSIIYLLVCTFVCSFFGCSLPFCLFVGSLSFFIPLRLNTNKHCFVNIQNEKKLIGNQP